MKTAAPKWEVEAARLREKLAGNEPALKLIEALLKIREESNYGCRQCFTVSFLVDQALSEA